ncbi:MAG: hypothetical protein FIB08_08845 [Candidatus Methanoperedens sp.]|nr:hypothetical protein [Candidatus Methanoperedens sp.]
MEEGLIKTAPNREKAKSILKITVILLLDGYKTQGEGAHKKLIEYLEKNYGDFRGHEISLIDDLRVIRNKIAYNGFFVQDDYLERKRKDILVLIQKLRVIIYKKL